MIECDISLTILLSDCADSGTPLELGEILLEAIKKEMEKGRLLTNDDKIIQMSYKLNAGSYPWCWETLFGELDLSSSP